MKRIKQKRYHKAFQETVHREHRSSFLVFSFLRALVALVRRLMRGSYECAFLRILTLLLLYVPRRTVF